MIKPLIRGALHRMGYTLVKYRTRAGGFDVGPAPAGVRYDADMEPEFRAMHARCAEFTMTPPERMYNLWLAMRHVLDHGIPGDIVECGVWRGGSAMLAAHVLRERGDSDRRVWLYDTFEGMTAPTEKDVDPEGLIDTREIWARSQKGDHNEWCYASLEDVRRNMASTGFPDSRTVYVKGKVEETLPKQTPDRIALLRLDTDWHASTAAELGHLYPKLSPGGVLLVDDYGQWKGQREAVDEYLAQQRAPLLLARIDAAARMGVKPVS